MDTKRVRQVIKVFNNIDRKIIGFISRTGLVCQRCLGHCCGSEYIETTLLDLYPVVDYLKRTGRLGKVLKKIEKGSKECVFYSKKQTDLKNCHCSVYLMRPTICRLFGFGTVRDKNSRQMLVTCKKQRVKYGKLIGRIESDNKLIGLAPNFSDISMTLYNIDPLLGSKRFHINDALKILIEREMLRETFEAEDAGKKPDKPKRPIRAA